MTDAGTSGKASDESGERALAAAVSLTDERDTLLPEVPRPPTPRGVGHAGVIAFLGAVQALTLAASFARWKVVALLLGPSGMGIASVIDQVAQLAVQFGSLSLPTTALRYLSIARAEHPASFGGLHRTLVRLTLAGTALVAAITLAAYLVRPSLLGSGLAVFPAALVFALIAVPHTGAANLLRNTLSTLERYRTAAVIGFCSSLALALATFVGIRLGGVTGLYVGTWIAALGTHLLLHFLLSRQPLVRGRGGPAGLRTLIAEHPEVVRFSAMLYTVGFTTPLSYGIARFAVLERMGAREVGFLAAAFTLASGVRGVLSQSTSQLLLPLVSRPGSVELRAAETASYVRSLSLLVLAVVLPVMLFPHELLLILFSRQFMAVVAFLFLFVLAEVVLAMGDAYRVLLTGVGDMRGYFVTTLSATLVLMVGAPLAVPRFGIVGVGAAHLTGATVALMASFYRLRRKHHVDLGKRALAALAFCLASLVAGGLLGRAFSLPGAVDWMLKIGFYVMACTASLGLLSPAERAAIRPRLRRLLESLRRKTGPARRRSTADIPDRQNDHPASSDPT